MFYKYNDSHDLIDFDLKSLDTLAESTNTNGAYTPINALTGKGYNGINRVLLANALLMHQYKKNIWATFLQAQELGLTVTTGQKATKIIYWTECPESGLITTEYASLYNIEQMNGAYKETINNIAGEDISDSKEIMSIISKSDVNILHTDFASCYQRKTDTAYMRNSNQFNCSNDFYADWIKQIIRSTKHAKRLMRSYITRTTTLQEAVACEELVVFIAARFLGDRVGCKIPVGFEDSLYKSCWNEVIYNKPQLLLKICADAQKSVEYIMNHWCTPASTAGDTIRYEAA